MDPRKAEIPAPRLIRALRRYDLLPAIVFLPTRRKCDEAAADVAADKSQKNDPERLKLRKQIFDDVAAQPLPTLSAASFAEDRALDPNGSDAIETRISSQGENCR